MSGAKYLPIGHRPIEIRRERNFPLIKALNNAWRQWSAPATAGACFAAIVWFRDPIVAFLGAVQFAMGKL